ncbi:hypothetical protein BASA83_001153 [Batrachochytrium salamandrivorans]|nr:hypothetical protein BASA83_001153 [Batrachochytrium salamandrivorans]
MTAIVNMEMNSPHTPRILHIHHCDLPPLPIPGPISMATPFLRIQPQKQNDYSALHLQQPAVASRPTTSTASSIASCPDTTTQASVQNGHPDIHTDIHTDIHADIESSTDSDTDDVLYRSMSSVQPTSQPLPPRRITRTPLRVHDIPSNTADNNPSQSQYDRIIMGAIFAERKEMTDVSAEAELERQRRMGLMIRSSRRYNKLHVAVANKHFEAEKNGDISIADFIATLESSSDTGSEAAVSPTTDTGAKAFQDVGQFVGISNSGPALEIPIAAHPRFFSSEGGSVLDVPKSLFGELSRTTTEPTNIYSMNHMKVNTMDGIDSSDLDIASASMEDISNSDNTLAVRAWSKDRLSTFSHTGTATSTAKTTAANATSIYTTTSSPEASSTIDTEGRPVSTVPPGRHVTFKDQVVVLQECLQPCGKRGCTCSIDHEPSRRRSKTKSIIRFVTRLFRRPSSVNASPVNVSPVTTIVIAKDAETVSSKMPPTASIVTPALDLSSSIETPTHADDPSPHCSFKEHASIESQLSSEVVAKDLSEDDDDDKEDEVHSEDFEFTDDLELKEDDRVAKDLCAYAVARRMHSGSQHTSILDRLSRSLSPLGLTGSTTVVDPDLLSSPNKECSIPGCPDARCGIHSHMLLQDSWLGGKRMKKDAHGLVMVGGVILRAPTLFTAGHEGRTWTREQEVLTTQSTILIPAGSPLDTKCLDHQEQAYSPLVASTQPQLEFERQADLQKDDLKSQPRTPRRKCSWKKVKNIFSTWLGLSTRIQN